MKEMKRLLTGFLLFCSLFFTGCTFVISENDIGLAKTQVRCRYEISGKGTIFTWNHPAALEGKIDRYFISENSSSKQSSGESLICKVVPEEYRHGYYSDSVSIKASVSEVTMSWVAYTSKDYYLWVETSDGYDYNLGKFITVITDVDKIIDTIKFNKTFDSYDNTTTFEWAIRTVIPFNPLRFIINQYTEEKYNSDFIFSNNLVVGSSYHDDSYNDSVSITPGVCNTQSDGMDTYKVEYAGSVSKTYYLWAQIEDGCWYNLGRIE